MDVAGVSHSLHVGMRGMYKKATLTQLTGTPMEDLFEFAGRGCYDSLGKKGRPSKEYHENIIQSGHWSVARHGMMTFWIEGISRATSMEHNRHDVGCEISQRSTRYCDEDQTPVVLSPVLEANWSKLDTTARYVIDRALRSSAIAYKATVDNLTALGIGRKQARGAARDLLPNGLETAMTWSCSVQALIHYLKMRGHASAEPSIRWLAQRLFDAAEPACPEYFQYFEHDFVTKDGAPTLRWNGPDIKPRPQDLERIAELEARLKELE